MSDDAATKNDGMRVVLAFFLELTGHSWMEVDLIDHAHKPLRVGSGTIGDAMRHMRGLIETEGVFERGTLTDLGQEMFEELKGLAGNPA